MERQNKFKYYPHCTNSDNVICFKALSLVMFLPEKYETTTFKTKNILDCLKPDHFFSGDRFNQQDSRLDIHTQSAIQDPDETITNNPKRKPVYESENVLLDRERHKCAMARKRLSTRERRKDLAEKFRSGDSYAKEVVNRWLRSTKQDRDAIFESGASAAKRKTEEIQAIDAHDFSFEEEDKTITDMLDSLDQPLSGKSPLGNIGFGFKREVKDKDKSKLIVESELEEFEKFMNEADQRERGDTNVRKIEHEMDTYENRRLFEPLNEETGEDNLWVTMSNQDSNKFNILNFLNQRKTENLNKD